MRTDPMRREKAAKAVLQHVLRMLLRASMGTVSCRLCWGWLRFRSHWHWFLDEMDIVTIAEQH